MTRASRITCMVLATLAPPTAALGTQGDLIGLNASPCVQKSAGKKGGTHDHDEEEYDERVAHNIKSIGIQDPCC